MQQATPGAAQQWFVYVVECIDGTLYTGVTTDVTRRVREHNEGKRGAKYTRSRRPVKLRFARACDTRSDALKEEIRIKRLKRCEKQRMIRGEDLVVKDYQA